MQHYNRRWITNRDFVFDKTGKHKIESSKDFSIQAVNVRFHSDYILTPSYHDYLEIVLIKKGKAMVNLESRSVIGQEGDLVMIGPDLFHVISPFDENPTEFVCIFFNPNIVFTPGSSPIDFEFIRPFYEQSNNFIIPYDSVDPGIPDLLRDMVELMNDKKKYYQQLVKADLLTVLSKMLVYYENFDSESDQVFNKKFSNLHRLKTIFEYISENLQNQLSLDDISSMAYMSKSYFCRFFKETTGFTFTDYVTRMRIDKAKLLVLKSNYSISQISSEVGFQNTSSFNKAFKKLTHLSPGDFRKSHSKLS